MTAPASQRSGPASLANYLAFLLPNEPDELIGAAAHGRIAAVASTMLPIPRIAVECRLAAGDDQIDIQQCVRRDDGEYPALAGHIARLADTHPGDRPLACLNAFCADLAQRGSVLHRGIEEIYLEYDLPSDGRVPLVPGVFFSLPDDQSLAREVVAAALTRLRVKAVPPRMQAAIEDCFAACAGDAHVAHVGIMLSRPIDVVRVNIKGLRPAQVEKYLADCEWPGDRVAGAGLFAAAADRADRVTLALDVGETLLPRIGVESFLDEQPPRDPCWRLNLDELNAEGLCAPSKAAAFLAMPADVFPASATRPWPTDFVMESLVRSPTEFSCFARRAVHFKVTVTAGVTREAKAYFGAGHLWLKPTKDSFARGWRPTLASPRPRRSIPAPEEAADDSVDRAISRGIAFLLHRQLQSGLWKDFNVPTGISDEWVSGFIGTQLALTGDRRTGEAAEECYARLTDRQRDNGGWAYNRNHPADADSSSWVLRLAAALGRDGDDATRRGREFVARHSLESGGVVSFVERFSLAAVAELPAEASLGGWLDVHDCVTAAAAPFAPEGVHSYLRTRQRDGRWIGYWWAHDAYATALAVEALRTRPARGDDRRLAAAESRAMDWIRQAGDDAGDPTAFDLAFCLRILLGAATPEGRLALEAATRWLLDRQQDDGSWMQGARLRLPERRSVDPNDGSALIRLDERRSFSTAAVVGALAAFRRAQARP